MITYRLSDYKILSNGEAVKLPEWQTEELDLQTVIDRAIAYGDGTYIITVSVNGESNTTIVVEIIDGVYFNGIVPSEVKFTGKILQEMYVYFASIGQKKDTYKVSLEPKRTYTKVFASDAKEAISQYRRIKPCRKI
jgi:hypothetical protein